MQRCVNRLRAPPSYLRALSILGATAWQGWFTNKMVRRHLIPALVALVAAYVAVCRRQDRTVSRIFRCH